MTTPPFHNSQTKSGARRLSKGPDREQQRPRTLHHLNIIISCTASTGVETREEARSRSGGRTFFPIKKKKTFLRFLSLFFSILNRQLNFPRNLSAQLALLGAFAAAFNVRTSGCHAPLVSAQESLKEDHFEKPWKKRLPSLFFPTCI